MLQGDVTASLDFMILTRTTTLVNHASPAKLVAAATKYASLVSLTSA